MGTCLIRPLGLAPAADGLSGLLRGGDESVPAPSSDPGLALVKGCEAEESGVAARARKTQEYENLGAGNAEGEAAAGHGEMSGPPR